MRLHSTVEKVCLQRLLLFENIFRILFTSKLPTTPDGRKKLTKTDFTHVIGVEFFDLFIFSAEKQKTSIFHSICKCI